MAIENQQSFVLLVSALLACLALLAWRLLQSSGGQPANNFFFTDKADAISPYEDIEPLPYSDLSTVEPIAIRPFRPKFFLVGTVPYPLPMI